jgi:hypothetical protein
MRKTAVYVMCLAACSTCSSGEPDQESPRLRVAAELLGEQAEGALQLDAPWRLDLPLAAFEPPRRHHTSEVLDVACRAGHRGSCWYLVYLATSDGALVNALRMIADDCQVGDFWSCRALPPSSRLPGVSAGLPGEQGRARCVDGDTGECNRRLNAECQGGFSPSCRLLATRNRDAGAREQLLARAAELSREGCAHGVIHDCETVELDWPERERWDAYEILCKVHRWECRRLGAMLENSGQLAAAFREYERACQYESIGPYNCLELAERYLAGEFPEPVPGRARKLLQLACAKLAPSERDGEPQCKP